MTVPTSSPLQHTRTPYEARVELATSALLAHSRLLDDEARDLARHVLRAVDLVPERVR
jgi:hypothetical protein